MQQYYTTAAGINLNVLIWWGMLAGISDTRQLDSVLRSVDQAKDGLTTVFEALAPLERRSFTSTPMQLRQVILPAVCKDIMLTCRFAASLNFLPCLLLGQLTLSHDSKRCMNFAVMRCSACCAAPCLANNLFPACIAVTPGFDLVSKRADMTGYKS